MPRTPSPPPCDLIELGPRRSLPVRVARVLRTRLRRRVLGLRRLARGSPPSVGRAGPRFDVSGHRASFEELERIVFHPEVMEKVETRPTAPLQRPSRPPPALPRGV